MTQKLTLETLESWLWESANIMRGSIDSSDFKNYIFGLIFLKRYNDVFEERIAAIMQEEDCSRDEAIEEEKEDGRHYVPEEARWGYIIKHTQHIGEFIDEAFAAIEALNPYLEGVLTAIQFGDKKKLGDKLLERLLRHFNRYNLGNHSLYKSDMLGDAYEYLIGKFADDAGKKGGEFYTPKPIVQLIVRLLDPQPGQTVYDPACGCGGMLVESAHHVAELPGGQLTATTPNISLYGQEKNLGTWAISKLNLIERKITATRTLKKGLMQRLFSQGVGTRDADGHWQPHTEFKDSELGRIPAKWEVTLLDQLTNRGSGHTPDKQMPDYWNGGVKWISLADSNKLDQGTISFTDKEISLLGIQKSSAVLHPQGTVVLSRDAGIGKSAVMGEDMAVSQHFIAWNCKPKGRLNN